MFDFDKSTGEILIYDEITKSGRGGVDSGAVIKAMKAIGKQPLTIRINSPGGDVDEGIAIANALARHPEPVTTINDAIAASIANYIYMAGTSRLVAKNARAMIHEPWTMTAGTADELRQTAILLDEANAVLHSVYADKLKASKAEVSAMMKAETWFNSNQQMANGMATGYSNDQSVEPVKIAASMFRNTPPDLIHKLSAGEKTPYYPKLKKLQHLTRTLEALR